MFTNFYLTICVRRSGGDTTIRLSFLMSGASRLATRPFGTNFTEFAAAQELRAMTVDVITLEYAT